MHNAIPRDGKVVFAVPQQEKETLRIHWNIFTSQVEDEFHVSDQAMVFNMESTDRQAVIAQSVGDHIIRALQGIDNGVFTMCQDEALSWMVETSSNVASVVTEDEKMTIVASQRSNVMSNLDNQCNTVKARSALLAGASTPAGEKRGSLISVGSLGPSQGIE